jgi:hypothetical protein
MPEHRPGVSRWREGVGLGVGHVYTQGTVQGARVNLIPSNYGFWGSTVWQHWSMGLKYKIAREGTHGSEHCAQRWQGGLQVCGVCLSRRRTSATPTWDTL